ncbi:MAG: hypothetical protein K6G86_05575 [Bacteroidales bacterium]|nr:hypothetical protein [Bacteroidales bacterium]
MKTLKLLTLTLITLMTLPFSACAKDDNGHSLTKLWAAYEKAVDADKPKDQADILVQIKKEAAAQHLAWDYYDACWKYVQARSSTNWKLHEELVRQANEDIEKNGEPVAVFFNRKSSGEAAGLLAYITEQKERMLKSYNPEFYDFSFKFEDALTYFVKNDYEYALWSLYGSYQDSGIHEAIQEHFAGRYPFDAFIEYQDITRKYSGTAEEEMPAYIEAHAGQAVSLLGRDYLLSRRQSKLSYDRGTQAQYRQLADDCQTFIADRKKFQGDESVIAKCCDNADDIIKTLTAQELDVTVEKGVARFVVRNLPSVKVRILDGKKDVWNTTVDNPARSFYLRDTLTLKMPDLEDKTYNLKCSYGKVETESNYQKYTLSIATKRDLDGYGVFVADYLTGEPVKSCDIFLYDENDKLLEQLTGFQPDGFTYLPESFARHLEKTRWGLKLQAVARMDGRVRASMRHNFFHETRKAISNENPDRHHAMIITDRGAFNPDETVHYKVLLYEGTYEYATRPEGVRLHVTLTDPTGKEIDAQDLTTNNFGSAAGAFVLKKGERGGMYTIRVKEDSREIASTQVRADEFVLPTFELTWKRSDRFYLPDDNVLVEGNIRSYSGHNLGTATAIYSVTDAYSDEKVLAQGDLELAAGGDFGIRFKAPEFRYGNHSLVVTVRVTDATGETLEFHKTVNVSSSLPVQVSVQNKVSGRFEVKDSYGGGSIVGEDVARVLFRIGFGETLQHPGLKIEYKVLHEGKTVLSGTAPNGEVTPIDLSRFPSGQYTIEAVASAKSDKGDAYEDKVSHEIVKATDADTALDLDARCFFKEIADDGNGIALQVGATQGATWIVVELYGDGNRLLEKRIERLRGVRAQEGSLKIIRFARKADYPENLSLKVFWFHDQRSYTYTVTSFKPKARFELPLSFSRFLDTTAPHHDYSFTIRTAAGTEVAATIFDKSTETIQRNVWSSVRPESRSLPSVEYRPTLGADESSAYEREVFSTRAAGRRLSKASAAAGAIRNDMVLEDAPMMMVEREVAEYAADEAAVEEQPDEEIAVRENFANTIAWEPFLRSDKDGVVTFSFTTADKLSTYYVQLFAHDKDFHNETLRQEMVVTLPVKVAVVQPQFLYEGDRYVARVTVSNSKGIPISGRIGVKFLNGKDYKTAPVVSDQGRKVTVPANGSANYSCEISAPRLADLGMLVSFTADNSDYGSDAVFVTMPVSPAVQTITEAHSAILRAGTDRDALLAELRGLFINVPGTEAALREISILQMIEEAIPDKVIPYCENLLDQSEALYANYLIDGLPGAKGSAATAEQRADMVKKILDCKNGDGGFGWFPGMSSSPVLTATLLERLADMGEACPKEIADAIPAAVKYLDKDFFGDRKRPFWCGGLSLAQYLHLRARFPEVAFSTYNAGLKNVREFKKETKEYLVPGAKRGLNGMVFAKARRMKTLRALLENERGASLARAWGISLFAKSRLAKSLDKDVESLLQYAEPHRSGGIYYPNAVMPWRGLLESELYAHSLICDLLTACGHDEVAEGIRLWIMVQKETQHWEDDPAYIQAINSVLHGTEETLQTKVLALSATTTLPFQQIKAAGNGFTLSRSFTRDGKPLADGDVLHVGDKVVATYRIWNEENRSFVRLTAPRPAAFRPAQQLSGRYGWSGRPISITGWVSFSPQGYRSVLADRTEFWFDSYPEENTTLTEEYFVTQEGRFQSPVPVIESLYAPHYRANDDGHPAFVVAPVEQQSKQ